MKIQQQGFSLFEVLLSMFIAGIALLGLALMDIYILRSSQSSFNYTVATIRANSFVDAVWMDLCNAQKTTSASTYTTIRNSWINEVSSAGFTIDASNPPASHALSTSVTLSWTDPRFTNDDPNNTLTLAVQFPDSGCN